MNQVSVILPVYNEAADIQVTFDEVLRFLDSHLSYHFIFVDDGSTDQTRSILHRCLANARTDKISLLSYSTNHGKGWAIKQGIQSVEPELVCFIDSDLAYSLEHLEQLVEKLYQFDVVIGCRNLIPASVEHIHFTRKLAGKIFNLISQKILNLPFRDMQAGLKGFRNHVAQDLIADQTVMRFAFDAELLYLAKQKGYSIGEIPAYVSSTHLRKKSKVSLISDSLKMLISLMMIRYRHRASRFKRRRSAIKSPLKSLRF
jgi:dolichyl-phosphate beta-glucosyltransferase